MSEPATPTPAPRRRRRWPWVILVLIVALLGLGHYLLRTDSGLDLVRGLAVKAAQGTLQGELRVGALTGDALSTLVVQDVRLNDLEGRPAIELQRLRLSWDPMALLSGTIHIQELELVGPHVLAVTSTSGALNLSSLTYPSTQPPSDQPPLPLDLPSVTVEQLTIQDGRFVMLGSDSTPGPRVDALALQIGLSAQGDTLNLQLQSLSARLLERYVVQAQTELQVRGHEVQVKSLNLSSQGAHLDIPSMQADLTEGLAEGHLQVKAPTGTAPKFGAPDPLQAGAQLDLQFSRTGSNPAVWAVLAEGQLADAPLSLSATVAENLGRMQAMLRIEGLNPQDVYADAPLGQLDLRAELEASLKDPASPTAKAHVELRGQMTPPGSASIALSPVQIDANLTGPQAQVHLVGRVGAAQLDARLRAHDVFTAPVIDDGEAELSVPDLGALLGAGAQGQLHLSAHGSGPLQALSADGLLSGSGLRWRDLAQVKRLDAEWSVRGLPQAPVGTIDLHLGQSKIDGRPIDALNLRVEARQLEGNTQLDLRTFNLGTAGLIWSGEGAVFTRSPKGEMTLKTLSLRSSAGSLSVQGQMSSRGPLQGPSRVDLELERLDLGALPREFIPELKALQGRVSLQAELRRKGPKLWASVKGEAQELAAGPDDPPADVQLQLHLDPRAMVLSATVASDGLGNLVATAQTTPPRRMDSVPSWQAHLLSPDGLPTAAIQLRGIQLAAVQRLAGQSVLSEGQLSGHVELDGATQHVVVDLLADSLRSEGLDAQGRLHILAGFEPGQAWTHGQLQATPLGHGTFTATISAPAALNDTQAWSRLDTGAVRAAQVNLERMDLGVLSRLAALQGISGQLKVHLMAGPKALPLEATVDAREVRIPWMTGLWSAQSALSLGPSHLQHTLEAQHEGRDVVSSRLSAPLSLSQLLKASKQDLETLPVDFSAHVHRLELEPLCEPLHLVPCLIQGTVTASASASGSAASPKAHLQADFTGMRLAETRFKIAQAGLQLKDGRVKAQASLVDAAGGHLELGAKGSDRGDDIELRLDAEGLDLSFLSKLGLIPLGLRAGLFARVEVFDLPKVPRPMGWVELRDLRVAFAQAALQPLHSGLARLDLQGDHATLTLKGASGGGALGLDVQAQFPRGEAPKFQAKTKLESYPVAAGALVRIDLDAEAEGVVEPDGTKVQVILTDGLVTVPKEDTKDLLPIEELEDVVFVDNLPGGTGGRLSKSATVAAGPPTLVDITTAHPIDVRGGPVDAAFITDLHARSSGGKNRIQGRVYSSEGAITLFRRRYLIERAELTFDGRDPPNPRVDVRLRHEFTDLSFQVLVRGTAEAPDLEFAGSPARFSQTELLTIFMGTDPQDLGKQDNRTMEQQAVGAVAGFLVGRLQDQLGQALPIDTLDVELGDTAARGAGTRVTLGKWITRKLFLAYRYKFEANTDQENDNEAVIQYRFLPGWMVEVVLGLTRNDADLFWTKRF